MGLTEGTDPLTHQIILDFKSLDDMAAFAARMAQPVNTASAGSLAGFDDAALLKELRIRLDREDKSLFIRAKRNSRNAADEGEDESESVEADETDEDPVEVGSEDPKVADQPAPPRDFDAVMAAVKASQADGADAAVAAAVRSAVASFLKSHPSIKKLTELMSSTPGQKAEAVEHFSQVPGLFADDAAEPKIDWS